MDAMATQGSQETASSDAARFRAIFDVLDDGLIVWGHDGRVLTCNRRAEEIIGFPFEQLESMEFEDLLELAREHLRPISADGTPRDRSAYPAIVAAQQRSPVLGQVMGVHRPDGRLVWLEIDVRVLDDPEEGSLLVTSFRDITATKETQDNLKFQARLLEAVGQAVVATDATGKVLSWNDAAEQLFGWTAAHAVGREGWELVTPLHTPAEVATIARYVRQGRTWSGYFATERHDGVQLTLFVTNTPVFDDQGNLSAVIAVSSDVSEFKSAQDHIRRALRHRRVVGRRHRPLVDRRPGRIVERRCRGGLRLSRE